jgi:hypothetical protein
MLAASAGLGFIMKPITISAIMMAAPIAVFFFVIFIID